MIPSLHGARMRIAPCGWRMTDVTLEGLGTGVAPARTRRRRRAGAGAALGVGAGPAGDHPRAARPGLDPGRRRRRRASARSPPAPSSRASARPRPPGARPSRSWSTPRISTPRCPTPTRRRRRRSYRWARTAGQTGSVPRRPPRCEQRAVDARPASQGRRAHRGAQTRSPINCPSTAGWSSPRAPTAARGSRSAPPTCARRCCCRRRRCFPRPIHLPTEARRLDDDYPRAPRTVADAFIVAGRGADPAPVGAVVRDADQPPDPQRRDAGGDRRVAAFRFGGSSPSSTSRTRSRARSSMAPTRSRCSRRPPCCCHAHRATSASRWSTAAPTRPIRSISPRSGAGFDRSPREISVLARRTGTTAAANRFGADYASYQAKATPDQGSRTSASSPARSRSSRHGCDLRPAEQRPGRQIHAAQARSSDAAADATSALDGLSFAIPLITVLAAVLALFGLRQRINEYR